MQLLFHELVSGQQYMCIDRRQTTQLCPYHKEKLSLTLYIALYRVWSDVWHTQVSAMIID